MEVGYRLPNLREVLQTTITVKRSPYLRNPYLALTRHIKANIF
jgi:hypothetical protein